MFLDNVAFSQMALFTVALCQMAFFNLASRQDNRKNDRKRWENGYFVLVLLDLQLILEFPGNLPVNYDNLSVIYRLPVN